MAVRGGGVVGQRRAAVAAGRRRRRMVSDKRNTEHITKYHHIYHVYVIHRSESYVYINEDPGYHCLHKQQYQQSAALPRLSTPAPRSILRGPAKYIYYEDIGKRLYCTSNMKI